MKKVLVKRISRVFSVLIGKANVSRIVLSGHGPREIRSEKAFVKRTSRAFSVLIGKTVGSRIVQSGHGRSASAVSRDANAVKMI